MKVTKGEVWIGGLDKPFIASWDMIGAGLERLGLELADHWERDERELPIDPTQLPGYSDDWDNVAVLRVLRTQDLALPAQVRWAKQLPASFAQSDEPDDEPEPDDDEPDDDDDVPVEELPEVVITADPQRPSDNVGALVFVVALLLIAKHYLR